MLEPGDASAIVAALPPADRFVLQLRGLAAGTIAGIDLDGPINSALGTAERFAARLGPNEWLLVLTEGEGAATRATLELGLAGHFFSLVSVGHRNAAIAVRSRHARTVLNAGITLDLEDAAFPAGTATRTLLGKAEVVLVRLPADDAFRVECWRSFAPYVHAFLSDAAREFI
jgi:sarcosine oxidase subunit gamma